MCGAYRTDYRLCLRVVDVPAIPGQEVVHVVDCGQRNVGGIILCGRRQGTPRYQRSGKLVGFVHDFEDEKSAQGLDAALRRPFFPFRPAMGCC